MNIIFPEYIRKWITEAKGDKSPARFVVDIVVAHYNHTSYKEKTADGREGIIHPVRTFVSED